MIPDQPVDDDRSIAGEIARSLAARIVTGILAPGTRLLQDEIAGAFKASHVPVREAFRRLEAQGLIVLEPRRGARVASLNPEDVIEVTEMRAALEPLALQFAAPNMQGTDIAEARNQMAQCDASNEIAVWEAANRRFHATLYAPGGQPRLLACIADLHQASARHLFAAWQKLDWQERSNGEHSAIVDWIEAGRTAEASALLRTHILDAGHAIAATMRS